MPDTTTTLDITICMGSSCFSRGNNRNVEVLQDILSRAGAPASVRLVGHHCENQCKNGPNITINGKIHHDVDPVGVLTILSHHVSAPGPAARAAAGDPDRNTP